MGYCDHNYYLFVFLLLISIGESSAILAKAMARTEALTVLGQALGSAVSEICVIHCMDYLHL